MWSVIKKIVKVNGQPVDYAYNIHDYDDLLNYLKKENYSLKEKTQDEFYEVYALANAKETSKSMIFYFNTQGRVIDYKLNDYQVPEIEQP